MWNKVATFIKRQNLLDIDKKHLVALSGGADSVALLLLLRRLGYTVEAVHCNFHLRGAESNRDEQFVCSLCEKESVIVHLAHFDTKAYAELHQVSIEMAARELRYRYFEQLRQDISAEEVCVAHHQDDAVETLLMNLIRGTGIHGLTGIRPRNGHIVRPLLCVSRGEIVAYLNTVGQPYVTDSSNLVPDIVRNKLRLQVLPLLKEINPAASANIAKTAHRMAEVEQVFDLSVQTALSEYYKDGTIAVADILHHPSPECLLHELLSPYAFTPAQVEQVFANLSAPSGRIFQSPTHEVAIDRGRFVIDKRHEPLPALCIPEPGVYHYANHQKFRFEISDQIQISKSSDCASLDADKVRFPLTIRPVQTGDRFQPFGMKGSRLVNDYLTDRKCSIFEKRRQLVITDTDNRIIWLVGQRTDQRFCVNDATKSVLLIKNCGNL